MKMPCRVLATQNCKFEYCPATAFMGRGNDCFLRFGRSECHIKSLKNLMNQFGMNFQTQCGGDVPFFSFFFFFD